MSAERADRKFPAVGLCPEPLCFYLIIVMYRWLVTLEMGIGSEGGPCAPDELFGSVGDFPDDGLGRTLRGWLT